MKDHCKFLCVSPIDTFIFLVSLLAPILSIAKTGFQIHSQGPLILIVLGAGFRLWTEWLRYKQWLEHKDTGFVPGSQHLSLLGTLGLAGGVFGAVIWLLAVRR